MTTVNSMATQATAQYDWLATSAKAAAKAVKRRDKGIARAARHADAVVKDWQEKALDRLRLFIDEREGAPFLAEEFVRWARFKVPAPPDKRAFGSVIQRAVKSGWIVKEGYAPASSSNQSPKCLWRGANAS